MFTNLSASSIYRMFMLLSFSEVICLIKEALKLPFKASFIRQITSEKDSSINILYIDEALKFVNIHNDQCKVLYLDKLMDKQRFGDIIYKEKLSESRYKITFTD